MPNKSQSATTVKRIIAITTITTLGAAGLANAQIPTSSTSSSVMQQAMSLFKSGKTEEAKKLLKEVHPNKKMHEKMHAKMQHKSGNRKAIEEAILAGDFAKFQTVASTSPLKNISESTFKQLTPQFQAKKNAENQIKSILAANGITVPNKNNK